MLQVWVWEPEIHVYIIFLDRNGKIKIERGTGSGKTPKKTLMDETSMPDVVGDNG